VFSPQLHFAPDQFVAGSTRVLRTAVPTIFPTHTIAANGSVIRREMRNWPLPPPQPRDGSGEQVVEEAEPMETGEAVSQGVVATVAGPSTSTSSGTSESSTATSSHVRRLVLGAVDLSVPGASQSGACPPHNDHNYAEVETPCGKHSADYLSTVLHVYQ
jgi:hypothetical protein